MFRKKENRGGARTPCPSHPPALNLGWLSKVEDPSGPLTVETGLPVALKKSILCPSPKPQRSEQTGSISKRMGHRLSLETPVTAMYKVCRAETKVCFRDPSVEGPIWGAP